VIWLLGRQQYVGAQPNKTLQFEFTKKQITKIKL